MTANEFKKQDHLAVIEVPEAFGNVVLDFARRDFHQDGRDRTMGEMILQLAVEGAECRRLHANKEE